MYVCIIYNVKYLNTFYMLLTLCCFTEFYMYVYMYEQAYTSTMYVSYGEFPPLYTRTLTNLQ